MHEGKEIRVRHDRIQLGGAHRVEPSQIRRVSPQEERTRRIEERRIHHRILIPVPIRQAESGLPGDLLADPFKIQQIRPVPIKEMVGTMLAEEKPSSNRARYAGLGRPARWIAARQRFHRGHRIAIGCDISVNRR